MIFKYLLWSFMPIIALSSVALTAQATGKSPRIEGLDAKIESLMKEGHFPGVAIAVMRDGKPIHIGTYGMADLANDVPVTGHTVFELASLAKQMTALAVMTLIEQGQLSLDSRLVKWIDDAPAAWSDITIGQLLSHTAGLSHRFEKTVDGELLLEYDRDTMLASAKNTPMIAKPGEDWNYSDQGYFLLGIIIERITGQSYAEFMQQRFFNPLGMKQTHLLDQRRIVPHLAQGYAWKDGTLQRNRRVWQFAVTSHFGVMSSLNDMMRWEAELSNPQLINDEAMTATWQIQRTFDTANSCDTWGYARGWQVDVVNGHRVLSHGGYAGTAYIRAIDQDLAVIVLTNRENAPNALSPLAIGWTAAHFGEPSIPATGFQCWQ